MKKAFGVAAIVAAALILTGAVLCGCAMIGISRNGPIDWNSGLWHLGDGTYRSTVYPITEEFTAIDVQTSRADLILVRSEDGTCRVNCFEAENDLHTVIVTDGTLTVASEQPRDRFAIDNNRPKITLYLPDTAYAALTFRTETGDMTVPAGFTFDALTVNGNTGDINCAADVTGAVDITLSTGEAELKGMEAGSISLALTTGDVELENTQVRGDIAIEVSTGDTDLENVTADGTVTLKCTTGETELENVTCAALCSGGSTGSVKLERTAVAGSMEIRRTTGDILLEESDAAKLTLVTTTGDVRGTLRTAKVFYTDTGTGSVSVPKSTEGGLCDVTTTTGDITLGIG